MFIITPLSEKDKIIKKAIEENKPAALRKYIKKITAKGSACLNLCFSRDKSLFFVLDALEGIDIPLAIDTQNKNLLIKALKRAIFFLINSTYPQKKSLKFHLELARQFRSSLIVLSVYKGKIEMELEKRKALIKEIITFASKENFPLNRLFIDVIILPFKYYPQYAYFPLILSTYIKHVFPTVKTIAGLDNFIHKEPNFLLKKSFFQLLSPTIDAFITKEFFL